MKRRKKKIALPELLQKKEIDEKSEYVFAVTNLQRVFSSERTTVEKPSIFVLKIHDFFFQILDRLGEWRECGRYAGTMQQGEEINIPCPPYDCKFICFSPRGELC